MGRQVLWRELMVQSSRRVPPVRDPIGRAWPSAGSHERGRWTWPWLCRSATLRLGQRGMK